MVQEVPGRSWQQTEASLRQHRSFPRLLLCDLRLKEGPKFTSSEERANTATAEQVSSVRIRNNQPLVMILARA